MEKPGHGAGAREWCSQDQDPPRDPLLTESRQVQQMHVKAWKVLCVTSSVIVVLGFLVLVRYQQVVES